MSGYYFNLPSITQLTNSQQAALNEYNQIALSGGPGTGKSVVSLYRHLNNYENRRKSLLLTYTTTLKQYFIGCCARKNSEAAKNIGTCLRDKPSRQWDEIIVDEAQDMGPDYYNSIKCYGQVSFGADEKQILYPEHSTSQIQFSNIFPNAVRHVLTKNFRNTRQIMEFAKQAFPKANINPNIISQISKLGDKPTLIITGGNNYEPTNYEQNQAIKKIIETFNSATHNIAILVPWKRDVDTFKNVLDGIGVDYSFYYGSEHSSCPPIKNIHLTTFKSAKGLEFDTVIIPNFQKYEEICGSFNTEWQDYYVACTRAKRNLYLISNYDIPNLHSVTE